MLVKSQIKYIQSLGQKKLRDEEGLFIAEGPKLVADLFAAVPGQFAGIYATAAWMSEYSNAVAGIPLHEISDVELERISQLSTPNQVIAVIRKFIPPAIIETKNQLILALDGIQDPGNLGTIIRIADWFGIAQVVCSHECADVYNPKVVQATMGSIARVKIIYTHLGQWLSAAEQVKVYAATLEGMDIKKVGKLSEAVVIIGNEARGISPAMMEWVQEKITINRKGKAESLNAAVATGIILSHIV